MKTKLFNLTLAISAILLFSFSTFHSQTLDELMKAGDDYYKKFDNVKALENYNKADKLSPNNWEVLWKISRAYVDIGEHMPTSTDKQMDEQEATYEKAVEYADKAVKLAPDKSVTYLRRAIAKGRLALFRGVFTGGIGLANDVKADCEKAIQLGNGGDDIQAIAHYVYARSHHKVSEKWAPARAILGLGWADIDIALEEYKKALELDPTLMMIYVDYAYALIEEDEYDLARTMLNAALKCPIRDEDDETKITEVKNLLKEIENE